MPLIGRGAGRTLLFLYAFCGYIPPNPCYFKPPYRHYNYYKTYCIMMIIIIIIVITVGSRRSSCSSGVDISISLLAQYYYYDS